MLLVVILSLFLTPATVLGLGFDGGGVRMMKDSFGGSGLTATRDFGKGEVLVSVPLDMCILARRDGSIRNLVGQSDRMWEALGDIREPIPSTPESAFLSWDLRLAFALLEATAEPSLAAQGKFWETYTGALPRPDTVTIPFCFSDRCLEETQDATLISRAREQKQRLAKYADFDAPDTHRVDPFNPSAPSPGPLSWAFAMVRSRCFQIAPDWFGVVPIIEIANHSTEPNAEFLTLGSTWDTAVCVLKSTEAVPNGGEVRIRYDANADRAYSNRRLFTQYGFVLHRAGSLPSLLEGEEDESAGGEETESLSAAKSRTVDALVDAALVLSAVEGAMLVEHISSTLGQRIRALPQSLNEKEILDTLSSDILLKTGGSPRTSLQSDEALLQKLESSSSSIVDEKGESVESASVVLNREQFAAAVRYRIDCKISVQVALSVIEEAQKSLTLYNN